MIKALIHTNIVLDALTAREPFREAAEKILLLAAEERFQGFIAAHSVANIYYLIRDNLSETAAREALRNLFQIITVIDIDGKGCEDALDSVIEDYEDALAAIHAAKAKADCIITRKGDFSKASPNIALLSPEEFLQQF